MALVWTNKQVQWRQPAVSAHFTTLKAFKDFKNTKCHVKRKRTWINLEHENIKNASRTKYIHRSNESYMYQCLKNTSALPYSSKGKGVVKCPKSLIINQLSEVDANWGQAIKCGRRQLASMEY